MGVKASSLHRDSLYGFTVKDPEGKDVDLSIYRGKMLLVVNVASKCMLTNNNYEELNALYFNYRDQGSNLEWCMLDVHQLCPFSRLVPHLILIQQQLQRLIWHQRPSSSVLSCHLSLDCEDLLAYLIPLIGLEILAFPCNQFNGQEPGTNEQIVQRACTVFKSEFPIFGKIEVNGKNTAPVYKFLKSSRPTMLNGWIVWNFTKFLVDKEGHVVRRYSPTTDYSYIENDIKKLVLGNLNSGHQSE